MDSESKMKRFHAALIEVQESGLEVERLPDRDTLLQAHTDRPKMAKAAIFGALFYTVEATLSLFPFQR